MKELIVKPSFSSKITVNNEYLEKQLIDLSIKGDIIMSYLNML